MRRVVQRFGGSLVVTIPADLARRLDLHEGDRVEVDEADGGIVVRPASSLADAVAEWEDLAPDLSEAELARTVREERDARVSSR
jgi:AbrB family looped-hinge helix DNA binding protein